jgi:hypothetical protein
MGSDHVLDSQLSDGMKARIMGLLQQGMSSTQVMIHHKAHVREMALKNENVTRDTSIPPSDVRNLVKKRTNKLSQKHSKDPINVKMWVLKNLDLIFNYVQHAPLDLKRMTHVHIGNSNFMAFGNYAKFGHGSSISFDATVGTNQNRVCLLSIV